MPIREKYGFQSKLEALNYANETNGILHLGMNTTLDAVKKIVEEDAIYLNNIFTIWFATDVSKYLSEKKVHLVISRSTFEWFYSAFLMRRGCPWEDQFNLHIL